VTSWFYLSRLLAKRANSIDNNATVANTASPTVTYVELPAETVRPLKTYLSHKTAKKFMSESHLFSKFTSRLGAYATSSTADTFFGFRGGQHASPESLIPWYSLLSTPTATLQNFGYARELLQVLAAAGLRVSVCLSVAVSIVHQPVSYTSPFHGLLHYFLPVVYILLSLLQDYYRTGFFR